MIDAIKGPWPWYVGGPLMGLFAPLLLLLGNRQLGLSSSLRAICAAVTPGRVEFFRYDWRTGGLWNVVLAFGILGGAATATWLFNASAPALSPAAQASLANAGLAQPSGLVPAEIFSWQALLTVRGAASMLGGGFLAGFGAAYGGGCTSGHGIMGLGARQLPSLVALMGIYGGGVIVTWLLIPALL